MVQLFLLKGTPVYILKFRQFKIAHAAVQNYINPHFGDKDGWSWGTKGGEGVGGGGE